MGMHIPNLHVWTEPPYWALELTPLDQQTKDNPSTKQT